jgi:Tol biopolymer transport system component
LTSLATRSDNAVQVVATEKSRSAQNPAFAPDGDTIIYTLFHGGYNKGPAGIYACPLKGGNGLALIDESGHDSVNLPGASWNQAANRIVFASDRVNRDEIWTMAHDGSDRRQITSRQGGCCTEPAFSPDGRWIVFEMDDTGSDETRQGSICKIQVDGTGFTKLTDGPDKGTDDRQPNWSPSGDAILFQRRIPGSDNWDIYTMNPDGTGLKQITGTDASDTDASFSPDGRWIVYSSDYGGLATPNIFIVPATGGMPERITVSDTDEDGAPSWSPDGRWILFESHPVEDMETPSSIWRKAVSVNRPGITANGKKETAIAQNENLILKLDLETTTPGAKGDWWLIHVTPQGSIEHLVLNEMMFKPGIIPSFQGDIIYLDPVALPGLSISTPGIHEFYFGVDLVMDGKLSGESLSYDMARVRVTATPSTTPTGNSRAMPVYNAAYQENFEADTMEMITGRASGAYCLIDPFEGKNAESIDAIHEKGNEVGCYISIGTGEKWREDFSSMAPYLVATPWSEWEDEYFVKYTDTGIIPVMKARIDLMAKWHCDWVEFDNMDWAFDESNRNRYGIQVTEDEAAAYFRELCRHVHDHGMKCMAKNMVDKASEFDGVLYESYSDNPDWWDSEGTWEFLNAGKPVIINHYNETDCDRAYADYQRRYNSNISFICEDANLKRYIHYIQP